VAAVLSNRVSERIRVPPPAIFLLAAAVASDVIPTLGRVSVTTVQRVVTVALAVILFDGGMRFGWRRFRAAAGPVVWVGVAGTFVTAAALATLAHILFGLEWRGRRCCWARRWPPPTRRRCSRCSGAARSRPQRHHPGGEAGVNDASRSDKRRGLGHDRLLGVHPALSA
jgi:Sodium/hydrogen exchanger family